MNLDEERQILVKGFKKLGFRQIAKDAAKLSTKNEVWPFMRALEHFAIKQKDWKIVDQITWAENSINFDDDAKQSA